MRAPHRTKFDASQAFRARKRLLISGSPVNAGEPIDKTALSARRLRLLFDQRSIVYADLPNTGEKLTAEQTAETFRGKRAKLAARPRRRPKPKTDPKAAAKPETVSDPAAIAAARAAVVIPDGWATLPWPQRLQLAAQFADAPVKNGPAAAAAIEAELARRGHP